MKMIRRFFAYMILFITVLVLAYGYVYWGNLFGESTPIGQLMSLSKQKPVVDEVKPELEMLSVIEQKTPDVIETQPDDALAADVATDGQAAILIEEEQAAVADVPVEAMLKENLLTENIQVEQQSLADDMVNGSVDEVAINSELLEELSIGDTWVRAREAFQYRDYETSIESYLQLISRTQDNFDAYDELGKVYDYYGKEQEAAAAYYEAAAILVRIGKIDRAADFMKPLSLMDAVKARALLALIEASAR